MAVVGRVKAMAPLRRLTIIVVVAGVVYPGVYEKFLSGIEFVNLDLVFIRSLSCIVDTDFFTRLLMSTTILLVILAALGVTYSISWWRNRGSVLGRSCLVTVYNKHVTVLLWLTILVYSSVSSTIFQTFACDDLGEAGDGCLRADYSITCGTARHHKFQIYATAMMLIYPLGIPLL
ncbi:unnamed protein product [Laminaria digitata]